MNALLIVNADPAHVSDFDSDLASNLSDSGSERRPVDDHLAETHSAGTVFEYSSVDAAKADLAQLRSVSSVAHAAVVPIAPVRPAVRRWRLALLVWIGVYGLLNILLIATAPVLGDAPLLIRTLVPTAILVPIIVTQLIPFVNLRFANWLAG